MSIKNIPLPIWFMIIAGPILAQVFKNWDRMPFNQHQSMIERISVNAAKYNPNTGVINLEILNSNYHDVSNLEVSCDFKGKSDALITSKSLKLFTIIHSESSVREKEKIGDLSLQINSTTCSVLDAEELTTRNGKQIPRPDDIKVSPVPITHNKQRQGEE